MTSCVFVSGFNILIISSISWELRGIRTQVGNRSITLQKILGAGSLNFITIISWKASSVDCVDIQMRSFQSIILFVVVNDVWYLFLLIEALTIDRVLCQIGLDHIKFAVMPSAFAFITETSLIVMMVEVFIMQLGSCFSKNVLLCLTILVVVFQIMGTTQLLINRCIQALRVSCLIKI